MPDAVPLGRLHLMSVSVLCFLCQNRGIIPFISLMCMIAISKLVVILTLFHSLVKLLLLIYMPFINIYHYNVTLTCVYDFFFFIFLFLFRKQLKIPSHISVLHVEQEVVGDDTKALQSVLECDEKREGLLRREKELNAVINSNNPW